VAAPEPDAFGVREALDRPWVLGIDASIKPLYGRQEGAEIGYNPTRLKGPSHVLHTFLVANLRLVLDVQVSFGKQHTSVHAKAAPGRLLDELGQDPRGNRRPALVRDDSGYGNEGILSELESRDLPSAMELLDSPSALLRTMRARLPSAAGNERLRANDCCCARSSCDSSNSVFGRPVLIAVSPFPRLPIRTRL
jgi:hypothetical protein